MNLYNYQDIAVGQIEQFSISITTEMMNMFQKITKDNNPLHVDKTYAKEKGYSGNVCYGMLTASFLSTLAGVYIPGKNSLIESVKVNFVEPVIVGDFLTIEGTVQSKNDIFKNITIKVEIYNQDKKKVLRGIMVVKVDS